MGDPERRLSQSLCQTETRAFVWSFVKEIEVRPGKAAIVYSIPTPEDSPMGERTR